MEAVMVEVLNRLGRARWRQRLDAFPATIGRSPACTVIVDERDISATHARVVRDADGSLVVEDAGSSNGLHLGKTRVPRVVLGQKIELRLGSVRLRFLSADAPVEKTYVGPPPGAGHWGKLAAASLPLLALEPLGERALSYAWALNVAQQVYSGLTLALTCCVWAFTWALATRIFQGHFRFVEHLAVAAAALVGMALLTGMVLPIVGFSLNVPRAASYLGQLSGGVICIAALAAHLVRATQIGPWRARAIGAGVVGAFAVLYVVQQIAEAQRPSTELPVQGVVMPPGWLLRSAQPADALFEQLDGLKADVDALRAEGK